MWSQGSRREGFGNDHECRNRRGPDSEPGKMNTAILYALLSLLSAGANDLVFKRYATKQRSRGMVVFTIGLVWALLQIVLMGAKGTPLPGDAATLAFGVAAGLALTLSNLLLIESLAHIEVGLGSTLYRLNTIGVVLLSVLFLQEPLGLFKAAGVISGVVAVLLLAAPPAGVIDPWRHRRFVWMAVSASLLRAVYGVITKAGLNQGGDAEGMLLIAALCWVAGGAFYARLREGRFRLTRSKIAYALVSGVLVTLIVNFLVAAVALGEASVVIPIANLSFVAALLFSLALRWETLSFRKLLAVACALLSIVLLAR